MKIHKPSAEPPAKKATAATNGKTESGAYQLPAKLPDVYYEAPKRAFWARNDRGEWIEYPSTHIRLILLHAGVRSSLLPGEKMSPVESNFFALRQQNDVQWAGPLAGFEPGIHGVCGKRILVTRGPKLIKPAQGEWPTLRGFLTELLGEQLDYLCGWVKSALRSLNAGRPFRPGQALAVAGPAGCGKSLLQGILTEILGGRVAKPYRYLIGDTAFNGELLGCEHLAIEDEAASTDLRTRRHFGSQLKNLIVNEVVSLHAKGHEAMSVTPFWRVSVTLNDEPENLMVLPPLDESLRDKVILLRAGQTSLPFGNDDLSARAAFRARLSNELPSFVEHLNKWRIPAKLADKRYGVKAWQNPELLHDLEALQPEFRLLELIDLLQVWQYDSTEWKGTASQLRRELEDKDKRGEVARLLSFNTACGVYLSRLKKHVPHRISQEKGANNTSVWVIKR